MYLHHYPSKTSRSFVLLFLLTLFAVSGCAEEVLSVNGQIDDTNGNDITDIDDSQKSECQLGGAAVKGVINAATVTIYTVDTTGQNSEAAGTSATDSEGKWSAAPSPCSADGFYRVEVKSGTYTSEATQETKENSVSYTAILDINSVDIAGSAESLAITPVSTFIDERATNIVASKSFLEKFLFGPTTLSDAIASATEEVKTHFGLETNPVVLQVNFDDGTAAATNPDGTKLGLILGAFTQEAENLGLDDTGVLMEAMAKDFADGEFDGKENGVAIVITENEVTLELPEDTGTARFTDALDDYMSNTTGTFLQSDIVIGDVTEIVADITTGIASGDTTAPTTTATPAGSAFATAQSVTLACDDGAGTGCEATYYTTDGSTPTDASNVYSTPIDMTVTTVLKFFSVDSAGNEESVKTETYTLDAIAPTTTATPTGGTYGSAQSVTLTCDDGAGSGCAGTYYTTNGTTPTTASIAYLSNISISSEGLTTLKFFSTDNVGNTEAVVTENYTVDTAPPTVSSKSPASGATGTPITTKPTATFDEAMDDITITTSTFMLMQGEVTVTGAVTYNSATRTATFTPSSPLDEGTVYTATLTTGITDVVGNPLAADVIWSFTTGDLLGGEIQGGEPSLTTAVSTLAGSGSAGFTNGTGASAQFNDPYSITTDGVSLYVADTGNHTIRKIVIATGVVTTLAGGEGPSASGTTDGTGTAARFNSPHGVTTDGTYVWVADRGNHTIRRIEISTGVVTIIAGQPAYPGWDDGTGLFATFSSPTGITTDGTNLYVTDSGYHSIRQIVISNAAVTTIAGNGADDLSDAFDTGAYLNTPYGITTDRTDLYFADNGNNVIRKVVISTYEVITIAGDYAEWCNSACATGSTDGTGFAARFSAPFGVATDGTNLYIGDAGNNLIRKMVISSNVVTTLAGSGTAALTNGTGTSAEFNAPRGVTTDGASLFVVDGLNHVIRKID